MLIRCFETLRMAMRAGGYILAPVQPVLIKKEGEDSGAEGDQTAKKKTTLRMKLVRTKDGKIWQAAYSSDRTYKEAVESGKAAKDVP